MALSGFGKSCNLDVCKEVMPYEIYTEDDLFKEYVPIRDAINVVKKPREHKHDIDEKEIKPSRSQLRTNIGKWNCKRNDGCNTTWYSSKYCELDCIVVRTGCETYR